MFLSMVGSVQFCQLETGFPKRLMGNIFIKFSELNKKMKAVFFSANISFKDFRIVMHRAQSRGDFEIYIPVSRGGVGDLEGKRWGDLEIYIPASKF